MTLFVPLDAEYTSDPKILRAGAMAELLYVRALALAKRLLTDGYVDQAHIAQLTLGIPGKWQKHVDALLEHDLWVAVDGGWVIAAWSKRNPSRAQIDAKRQAKQEAAVKGNHERWHSEKRSPECRLCIAEESQERLLADRMGSRNGSPEPEPEPEPEPSSSSSSHNSKQPPVEHDDERQAEAARRTRLEVERRRGTSSEVVNPSAFEAKVLAQLRAESWKPTVSRPFDVYRDAIDVMAEHTPADEDVAPMPDHLLRRQRLA